MMSNSMLKRTAIAALLASAPFASTDSTVSALRLHHRSAGFGVGQAQIGVPVNPTQMAPLSADQIAAALEAPEGNAMARDQAGGQQGSAPPRRHGCCHNTCDCLHHTCCTPYGSGRDAVHNAQMVHAAQMVGRNGAAAPSTQTMARESEDDNCSCAGCQCPTYHGGCHNEGECGCCCNGVDAACRGGQAVIGDTCNLAREVGGMVTECRLPDQQFFCVMPENFPVQCPTELPSLPQCPTDCSVPQCPTDCCCCADVDLSQCGTLATQGLSQCGKCAQCPCKTCECLCKCCGDCQCPSF